MTCEVLEAVNYLTDCSKLDLLGLCFVTLKKIENDYPNQNNKCKMKMLAAWQQQHDHVSQKGVPA